MRRRSPGPGRIRSFATWSVVLVSRYLGNYLEVKCVSDTDRRRDDRGNTGVDGNTLHKRSVDLQKIEGKRLKVRKSREPGAEVVESDANASVSQLNEGVDGRVGCLQKHLLRHLDGEVAPAPAGLMKLRGNARCEIGSRQLARRYVHSKAADVSE